MAAYTWGFGKYGQLGTRQMSTSELPQPVKLPPNATPTKVSCGAHFTAILCTTPKKTPGGSRSIGRVFTCGWGKYGRLGLGSEEDKSVPTEVLLDHAADVTSVSAGHWHAVCVATDGSLYSWGYNKHGVLGLEESSRAGPTFGAVPTRIILPTVQFKAVACGYNFTWAVSSEGKCYSWGCGRYGVLGHGDTIDRHQPLLVECFVDKTFKEIGCGHSHAALVESSGSLYTVGKGDDGALGHGKDRREKHAPTLVEALVGIEIENASCSHGEHHAHTLACTTSGEVFSWGDGYKGKLGHGNQESCDIPRRIDPAHFLNQKVVQVSCGGIHSGALTEDGCVFSWGCGSDGRLGHPEAKGHRYLFRSDIPRLVEGIPKPMRAVRISCSYYHSAAVCVSSTEQ